jgi:aminoglycoside 6-adenylyltransferase
MKTDLLQMLEWHATACGGGAPVDVWYIGTGMKEWVDEATWQQMHGVFGRFDRHDAWRALLATTDLFARVSREVADRVGLTYPEPLEQRVRGYLSLFDSRLA